MSLREFEASLESGLHNEMLSNKSFSYSENCSDITSK